MSDHTGVDGEGQGAPPRACPASYQETFNAIAAAVTCHSVDRISISVRAFYRALSYPDSPVPAPCDEPPSGRDRNGLGGDSPAGAVAEGQAPDLLSELDDAASILNSNDAPYCASAVERAAKTIEKQAADIERLTTALAESERKRVEAESRAAVLSSALTMLGSHVADPVVRKVIGDILARAAPTQETPHVES